MNILFWKDVRSNRSLLLLMAALLLCFYTLAFSKAQPVWSSADAARNLTITAVLALMVLQLPLAFVVGNSFAGERADRSAEFLGTLPVSRGRIIASKLLLVLGLLGLIWIPNLLVLAGTVHRLTPNDPVAQAFLPFVRTTFFVGLTMASVAWFFSARMNNPVFATCLGLLAPGVVLVVGGLLLKLCGISRQDSLAWYRGLCAVVALTAFVAGARYYLRRVEP